MPRKGEALDLFAGPGGWDVALHSLGIEPLGIEWDDAASATREAAGLRTLQADVSKVDPLHLPCTCDHTAEEMECTSVPWHRHGCPVGIRDVELLLASAPCPTYSSAGNGGGRLLTAVVVRCLHELAAGNDTRAECREEAYEILAPIYWERDQEKARKKKREPDREKTEARARRDADMSLLVVEPLRWVLALKPRFVTLEQVPEVLGLWSQMAGILDTLGYNCWTGVMEAERYGVPQTRKRAILMADREAPVHLPRPTHQRYVKGEPQRHEVTFEGEVLPWVSMAEALGWLEGIEPSPAPTIAFGHNAARVQWVYDRPAPTIVTTRRSKDGILVGRQLPNGEAENVGGWGYERPATSVCGDPRISPPGYRGGPSDYDADGNFIGERSMDNAVRVTEEEALILQSFPPDYPVQGTRRQRYTQIGNAVPPLLAHAILSSLLAPVLEHPTELAA